MYKKIHTLYKSVVQIFSKILASPLIKNSLWGVISNVLQNLLLSVFFIIMARVYEKDELAKYIIANTLYSFLLGFSSLGLGYWFIREIMNSSEKKPLIQKFFKMQLISGLFFFILNGLISFLLYDDELIRKLSVIIGINLIFDNLIYVIKYLNIAEQNQKKSAFLLTLEATLKCMIGLFIFWLKIDLVLLSILLISIRLLTLNLFVNYGSSSNIKLLEIVRSRVPYKEMLEIIRQNWSFVIIGSISIINWRIGNIFVSKFLTLNDVANYEISFKLLSLAYILPVIVSSALLPSLVQKEKDGKKQLIDFYKIVFWCYAIFGFFCYTFIHSFSADLLPLLFGKMYSDTAPYCNEMFLVMLVFPTVLIQANLLITIKLEKIDMICNLSGLTVNILLALSGLYLFKSLSVINYSIFISFIIFHLIQDWVLFNKKMTTPQQIVSFYLIISIALFIYHLSSIHFDNNWAHFILFWISIVFLFIIFRGRK